MELREMLLHKKKFKELSGNSDFKYMEPYM